MRIVFFGSGSFGVPTLARLAAGHEVVRVYTQPSRPAGRGGQVRVTPAGESARRLGLDVCECANVNAPAVVAEIRSLKAGMIVVVDFGQIMRAAVRGAAEHGSINLHGSLLPALRGAAPVNWAMIHGLAITGVTTFSIVDAVDAGDVYLQTQTEIDPHETAEELKARLAEIGAGVMVQTLSAIENGVRPTAQDHSLATPAPRLAKHDGVIDWSASATAIRGRVHGTWRWPGGQAVFAGATHTTAVTLARVEVVGGELRSTDVPRGAGVSPARFAGILPASDEDDGSSSVDPPHGTRNAGETPAPQGAPRPGTVLADGTIVTGEGRLRVLELQPAGKRVMSWKDFVNGHRVTAGDRFYAPPDTHYTHTPGTHTP